jgi:TonB-dependent starch-binding outer membrane protein SusC
MKAIVINLISVIILLGLTMVPAFGQNSHTAELLMNKFQLQEENLSAAGNIQLSDLLSLIENKHVVSFVYEDQFVEGKYVPADIFESENLAEDLGMALTQLGLTYFRKGDHTYVIKPMFFHEVLEKLIVEETVTGRVTDAQTGEALPGVNILIEGTSVGTTTNMDGEFELNVPDLNETLVFSYIGYNTMVVEINNRTQLNIELISDVQMLEDLVVIGYGTVRRENLTGSISVVTAEALENRPITNASQALQGVQGLYVNQAGGQPGNDAATIRIRGVGTIGGAGKLEPLVLVDGVEYSLNDINPNDIESISVLKDAASASIYGSRAANGVILITTKQGQRDRIEVSYSGYVGFQEATFLPDPVDNSADFMEMYNRAQVNQGSSPLYSEELINEFRTNPTSQLYPNTNWMDVLFDQAPMQEHNIRVSGGDSRTRYNLSAGYLDQDGVLKGMSEAKRYSINLRVNTQISDRLSVEGSIMGTKWDVLEPTQGMATAMNRIMRMVPVQPIGRMDDGNWPNSWVITPGQNSFQNPLMLRDETYRNETTNRILASASLNYEIIEGLNYQIRGSINNRDFLREDWLPLIMLHSVRTGEPERPFWSGVSQKTHRQEDNQHLTFTNTLNFARDISENQSVNVLLGSSVEKFESSFFQASVQGFPTMDLTELNIGTENPNVSGTSNEDVLLSYFGRIQYSLLDRYLFEFNSRYDGSSRFARGNRWGLFPSFSLGWRISEESFMQDLSWVNELKIRGSWGKIGNQEIGRFQFIDAVNLGFGYPFGGSYTGGSAVTQSRDPNLRWETTTITNIGLDWDIFDGRLFGEIEFFNKRTDGILRGIALPAQVGALAGPVTNIAVVDNKGFEIGINHRNQIGTSFSYNIGAHISRIKNEVIDLQGEEIFAGARITREGYPIESWYVLKTDGLFQTQDEVDNYPTISGRVGPGDIKYVDLNGDGVISGADRYIAGNTFPDYTYGFNIGMRYRGISLQTIWQGVQNIHVRPNFNLASPFNNGAGLTKDWLTDSWTPDNPNARLPRISARNQYTAENFSDSDFWLEDASYLRLKNIQISYQFTGETINRLGMRQLEVFANGQNLFTITDVKHFDPERNISAEHITQYPSVKTISFGVNVNF